MRGFLTQNLWKVKELYKTYKDNEELSPLLRELPWSHLLSPVVTELTRSHNLIILFEQKF